MRDRLLAPSGEVGNDSQRTPSDLDGAVDPGRRDPHADLLVEPERAGARVRRAARTASAPRAVASANVSTRRAWASPLPRWSFRVASRATNPQSGLIRRTAMDTTSPSESVTTRRFHGSKPGRPVTSAAPVLEGLALADRPLEERVLLDRPAGPVVVLGGGAARRTPRAGRARDRGAGRQLEHPAVPPGVVAERGEQPVARRALRHRHADERRALLPGLGLHPARRSRCRCRGPGTPGRTAASPRSPARPRRRRSADRRRRRRCCPRSRRSSGAATRR